MTRAGAHCALQQLSGFDLKCDAPPEVRHITLTEGERQVFGQIIRKLQCEDTAVAPAIDTNHKTHTLLTTKQQTQFH